MRPALGAALVALALAASAGAAEISRGELRTLAERAATDRAALAELERVESVDGVAVDLERALAGAKGEELSARLETLAEGGPIAAVDARSARRDARDILSERRFREPDVPRPFRGLLVWLGERLRPVGDALSWLAEHVPGGKWTLWAIAAIVVVLATLLVASVLRRRAGRAVERAHAHDGGSALDPRRIEREADEAERRGELELALRLRFRAGLIRLDRARAIALRDSLTSGEIARRLGSRQFDRVAAGFEEVVYGRRPPQAQDVAAAREGWARVLEEVRSR